MRIEEEYQDVFQNLEFAVAQLYGRNPEMSDYAVLRTYEALVRAYTAESLGREAKSVDSSGLEAELFHDVRLMCEWRLGRGNMPGKQDASVDLTPINVATLILCLKRLVKSVQKWNKRGGRKGYLDFMTQFIK
jgi:hypothetical protein